LPPFEPGSLDGFLPAVCQQIVTRWTPKPLVPLVAKIARIDRLDHPGAVVDVHDIDPAFFS
jgi:hypothetical protein